MTDPEQSSPASRQAPPGVVGERRPRARRVSPCRAVGSVGRWFRETSAGLGRPHDYQPDPRAGTLGHRLATNATVLWLSEGPFRESATISRPRRYSYAEGTSRKSSGTTARQRVPARGELLRRCHAEWAIHLSIDEKNNVQGVKRLRHNSTEC